MGTESTREPVRRTTFGRIASLEERRPIACDVVRPQRANRRRRRETESSISRGYGMATIEDERQFSAAWLMARCHLRLYVYAESGRQVSAVAVSGVHGETPLHYRDRLVLAVQPEKEPCQARAVCSITLANSVLHHFSEFS